MDAYTVWVCTCCMLAHANGECCVDECTNVEHADRGEHLAHGGDCIEPWAAMPTAEVYMGMGWEEHDGECLRRTTKGNPPGDYECDCEHNTFSGSPCDGCGSYLAGDRYAFSVFPEGWRTRVDDSRVEDDREDASVIYDVEINHP